MDTDVSIAYFIASSCFYKPICNYFYELALPGKVVMDVLKLFTSNVF